MTVPSGLAGGPVYLDHNATTPVDPRVAEAALPYLATHFGNPSSGHAYGHAASAAVVAARAQVAAFLGCAAEEIVFTGGGSDADTLAVRGAALAHPGDHVITQVTEHPAVLAVCESLERLHGFRVTRLPVDETGLVRPADLRAALTPGTVLVSVMHANNETGTIQPVRELAAIAHEAGALFHTDAAQTAGKIPVSVRDLGVDLLSITGHKFYAPKGVGALYLRAGLGLEPSTYGGGQERGLRAGTENVALIAALGRAAELCDVSAAERTRLQVLRELLHSTLRQRLPGRVRLNGHPGLRLPNTLNVSVEGVPAAELLAAVPEVATSTGSACHEGDVRPSPVLTAMGLPASRATSALRLTLGRWTGEDDVLRAAHQLADAVPVPTPR
ncbi:cysteine desulfurase [Amycolatopsis acidiphila]|uniref:cysteine desulfurase n=1 Tax=Amycolatopsis acidiphila TaxID=715473 RepID=A0A558A3G3_9PSEU|nr:cysteine desulfurase family protein [Amycolatopsis acidiphila]TVT18766.1 cysteine desulfurase [Amycolatopsis acidiphila]UIJ56956.1 cysteine desulfurase [Amycolatopsis acidiphila]GHG54122.1 cysteine desulfurase [Amycolatopsis acidiphila]